jgi:hypothetical protein
MSDELDDDELFAAIVAITGPDLRPVADADALVALAARRRLRPVLSLLFRHLRSPPQDWTDAELARSLSWLSHVGLRDYQASAGNETEIRLVKTHGQRPGCFVPAVAVLLVIGPGEIASFAAAHAASSWARGGVDVEIVAALTKLYEDPRFAPHRLELLKALSGTPDGFERHMRDALVESASSSESADTVAAALAGTEVDPSSFAGDLAVTFLVGDGPTREVLLPQPADHKHAFIRPSLAQCIRMVHEFLRERRQLVIFGQPEHTVMAQFPDELAALRAALDRPSLARDDIGDARVERLPGYEPGARSEAFTVSLQVQGGGAAAEERVLIHQIGDRLRVGIPNAVEHARTAPLAPEATRTLGGWQPAFPECVRGWRELIDRLCASNQQASMEMIQYGIRQRFIDYPGDWMLDRESIAALDPSSRLRAQEFLLDVLRHTAALPMTEQPRRRPVYAAAMEALARISDPDRAREAADAIERERFAGGRSTGSSFPQPLATLRATASRLSCTCDYGRSAQPSDYPDIVVEHREQMPSPRGKPWWHEVHFDCRCTACGARWAVVESVNYDRSSVSWTRVGNAPS